MGAHSIFFWILIGIMGIGVLQSLAIGGLFFFKRSGEKRANYFYGILLITIGLTLLHNILYVTGIYEHFPKFNFLPIYFTLAFPILLFYYVKLSLYPNYRFRSSDVKHFIFPIGQWLFFIGIFLTPVSFKGELGRYFYNPFYGAFEQFIYLSSFFAYMYFAYRYIRHRQKQVLDHKKAKQIAYLRTLLVVLFVLFGIHTCFVVTDFVSFEFLNINLRSLKIYAALGALSFAALVFWLGTYGFQVLFWGRRVFGTKVRNEK
ncbi:MAG: hypothetical protein DHS20C18_39350 [Saprospiraceae bacterium]|nr:MAG: hypothetical protein DHS20C18_39350 [Saprospiraceae bacterium]